MLGKLEVKRIIKVPTITEMIVVVAIITILSSVIFVLIYDTQRKSRNTTRVAQIAEYQKAFDIYYSSHGYYPGKESGVESVWTCLGDYQTESCWKTSEPVSVNDILLNDIVPSGMPRLHRAESTVFGKRSGATYTGIVYSVSQSGKEYKVKYFMEGKDESCILTDTTATSVGKDTLCTLTVSI